MLTKRHGNCICMKNVENGFLSEQRNVHGKKSVHSASASAPSASSDSDNLSLSV